MGEGREGTYVLGRGGKGAAGAGAAARGSCSGGGRRGWSLAGVGAAASRQRKTTAADDVQARRTEGAEQGAAAYGWGRGVGDLASEGGRRQCEGNKRF